ncbi:type 1 fimbriae major subunit FimA [Citrobacter werkmanii NBRC 105721]|nr:type 1 fimbriae major subunit FimA [Citrobacter werkmanii NBRC 105721]
MYVIQGKSMKRKLMTSSVIASLMLVAGAAVAADPVSVSGGTVHFEGELVNAACAVSTQSSDQVVTLGQYRTASFAAVGDTTAQIPFTIVLNDCDPKVAATAAVAFSGQTDLINNNLLAVSSSDNSTTAGGVGIEILDNTSTALKPDGATFSTAQALVEGTNTLRFSARYKATATSATPGQANADATFIMKYE